MAKENKVQRMFRLLTDEYDAKVGKNPVSENGDSSLKVVLTVYGQRMTFNSKDDDFRMFIVRRAREELNATFSAANIRDLALQLETIATLMEEPGTRENGCGCGCGVDPPVDDE